MKSKSGITLIALIITIIIMLILVGVTVSFVANGGLITKAKQAGNQTQIAADKELLEFDVILAMGTDGEINFNDFKQSAQSDGFTISGSSFPCTATSKNGNEFSISSDGKVTYIGEGEYYGDDSGSGSGSGSYYDSGSGSGSYYNSGSGSESDSDSSSESTNGNLGKHITYNNIEYIVMAEDTENGTVDLISADTLQVNNNSIGLCYADPRAITAVPAVDENNPTNEENAARARWSYNNAIETLVIACKDATGLTVDGTNVISVRSVGNTDVKYTSSGITGSDNPGTFTYDWQTAGAESDWYTANGYNMKAADSNYESDKSTMISLGIMQTSETYWIASRLVHSTNEYVSFSICKCNDQYTVSGESVWTTYMDSYGSYMSYGVRPIVTVSYASIASYLN